MDVDLGSLSNIRPVSEALSFGTGLEIEVTQMLSVLSFSSVALSCKVKF